MMLFFPSFPLKGELVTMKSVNVVNEWRALPVAEALILAYKEVLMPGTQVFDYT